MKVLLFYLLLVSSAVSAPAADPPGAEAGLAPEPARAGQRDVRAAPQESSPLALRVALDGGRLSVVAESAPLRDVLLEIARQVRIEKLVIHPDFAVVPVSVTLTGVSVLEALERVAAAAGAGYAIAGGRGEGSVRVVIGAGTGTGVSPEPHGAPREDGLRYAIEHPGPGPWAAPFPGPDGKPIPLTDARGEPVAAPVPGPDGQPIVFELPEDGADGRVPVPLAPVPARSADQPAEGGGLARSEADPAPAEAGDPR